VTFNGEAGTDHLTVHDQNSTRNDGYRITSAAVFKLFNGTTVENTINYSTDEAVTLNMGATSGGNTCNVDSPAPGTPVDINAGPLLNILRVTETDPTAPVTIDPAGGDDPVNVNSDNTGSAAVIFPATQRIGILAIGNGGVATVPAGGNKVLTITG